MRAVERGDGCAVEVLTKTAAEARQRLGAWHQASVRWCYASHSPSEGVFFLVRLSTSSSLSKGPAPSFSHLSLSLSPSLFLFFSYFCAIVFAFLFLNIAHRYYTRSRESPRAEVFQNVTVVGDDGNTTTEKRCVGMMKQIEKYALYSAAVCTSLMDQRRSILNQALRDYWAADALQTADPPSRRALRHIDPSAALHADDHATLAQRYGVSDGSVAVLAEMLQCVDTRWMVRALVHSKGDVEAAANMLLAEDRELVIPQLPDSPSSGSGEEADGGRKNSVLERMTSWLKASPSPSSQLRKSLEEVSKEERFVFTLMFRYVLTIAGGQYVFARCLSKEPA